MLPAIIIIIIKDSNSSQLYCVTDEVRNFSFSLMIYYYVITFGVSQTHEES